MRTVEQRPIVYYISWWKENEAVKQKFGSEKIEAK